MARSHGAALRVFLAGVALSMGALSVFRLATGLHNASLTHNALTLATALYSALALFYLRRAAPSLIRVELVAVGLLLHIYAVTLAETAGTSVSNTAGMFTMLVLAVGLVGVSMRVIMPMVILSFSTAGAILVGHPGGINHQYIVLLFAAGSAAICLAFVSQGSVLREIRAKVAERDLRIEAEKTTIRDELTGIANRRGLMQALDQLVQIHPERRFALVCFDLDGFKAVNDLYGHAIGDGLLKSVAGHLSALNRDAFPCLPSRLGGDEFALLLTDPPSIPALMKEIAALIDALREPHAVNGITVRTSASMGIALYPDHAQAVSRLFECADFALYKVKQSGKDGVRIFNPGFDQEMQAARAVDYALQNCNFEEELALVYQPQVDLARDEIVGFEALARWQSPILGDVSPAAFIPAAERVGLMHAITGTLLRRALADAGSWPEELHLSFNLSVRDITEPGAVEAVAEIVRNAKFPAERLIFEITETALMQDFETAIASIRQLSRLGARIALDDFGAGYSSFGQLDRLPIDILKLDRELLSRIGTSDRSRRIFSAVVGLADALKLDCIVEGVETEAQLAIVKRLGGRCVQGFHLGHPANPDETAALIRAQQTRVPAALTA